MARPDRYARQAILPGIGPEGQARLADAWAVVVGVGALGCTSADLLVRAGVGRVTLIDRDVVERSNLQRQSLFAERDEGQPKAAAAAARLRDANSDIDVRAVVADVTPLNAERLVREAAGDRAVALGAIVDGTDNFEARYLLNDVAVKLGVALLYAGAVGTRSVSAAFLPGGPCLRCVFEEPPEVASQPTCETAGVLGPSVVEVAARQAAEAIKVLTGRGDVVDRAIVTTDLWTNETRRIAAGERRADCPCCGLRRFEFLDGSAGDEVALCGRNAVQVSPRAGASVDLAALARRLAPYGPVAASEHLVRAGVEGVEVTVFADGRAIVKGTSRPEVARGVYAKWVGS